jgi:hypothetical protein
MRRSLTRSESSVAVDRVERLGFYLPTRPGEEVPTLPLDLTEIDDSELMILFNQFTAWSNYAAGKRSEAEIDEAKVSDSLGFAQAQATILGWEDGTKESDKRVTIAKARQLADADVQKALSERRRSHAHRKLVTTMAENFERSTALISRELSRRIGNSDVQRRQHRWGGG